MSNAVNSVTPLPSRRESCVQTPGEFHGKTIRTGALPVEAYNRSDPAAALTESGLTAHLTVAGPVRPAQLASAIEKSTERWASMNILDTTGRGLTVLADDQPDSCRR